LVLSFVVAADLFGCDFCPLIKRATSAMIGAGFEYAGFTLFLDGTFVYATGNTPSGQIKWFLVTHVVHPFLYKD
jgi:hypothetical protein